MGGNGFLSRIANPAGEAVQFSYTTDGLLTTEADARGNLHRFTHDALGRLVRDEDPAGGVKTLARVDTENGHEVTLTTALGRASTYTVELLPTGEVRRVNSDRAGARTTVLTNPNGSVTVTSPDGTRTTIQRGPDPRFVAAGDSLNGKSGAAACRNSQLTAFREPHGAMPHRTFSAQANNSVRGRINFFGRGPSACRQQLRSDRRP